MKRILFVALLGIIAVSLVSCGDDDEARTYYTVTFDADGGTPVPADQKVEEAKRQPFLRPHQRKQDLFLLHGLPMEQTLTTFILP